MAAYRRPGIVQDAGGEGGQVAAFNQNRISLHGDYSRVLLIVVCYVLVLFTVALCYVLVTRWLILQWVLQAIFASGILYGFFWLVQKVRRAVSQTQMVLACDAYEQDRVWLASRVIMGDGYAIIRDETDSIRFHASTTLTEHRHYPALPQEREQPDIRDTILTYWNQGASGRKIWEWINKDRPAGQKMSYQQIQTVLDTYVGSQWRDVHKRDGKGVQAEEYPLSE